jgi:G3E family GTPase
VSSRKQTLVALSTLEAEYIACSNAAREAKWLRQLSLDVQVKNTTDKSVPATIIFTDNQGALKTIYSGVTKANTKHIDVQYHNSRDLHHTGVLSYTYVKSSDNIADVMTKALHTVQHDALTRAMGLRGRPMELPRAGPLRQSVGRLG